MDRYFLAVWTLSIAAATPSAWAQPAPNGVKADPQDAEAAVPPLVYQSPLAGYRTLSDEKLKSWKDTNDNVGRIGGWRAYAKEAQQPETPAGSAPATADKPVPAEGVKPMHGGHGGHKMH